jgi:hypothetical protein
MSTPSFAKVGDCSANLKVRVDCRKFSERYSHNFVTLGSVLARSAGLAQDINQEGGEVFTRAATYTATADCTCARSPLCVRGAREDAQGSWLRDCGQRANGAALRRPPSGTLGSMYHGAPLLATRAQPAPPARARARVATNVATCERSLATRCESAACTVTYACPRRTCALRPAGPG